VDALVWALSAAAFTTAALCCLFNDRIYGNPALRKPLQAEFWGGMYERYQKYKASASVGGPSCSFRLGITRNTPEGNGPSNRRRD
jgi:hypothetical protein